MRIVVSIDTRLERTPDGRSWAGGAVSYPFWTRYLEVFEDVRVVTRVREVPAPSPAARPVDGPHVTVHALPFYSGPWQYLLRRSAVRAALRAAVGPDDAALLRVPGTLSFALGAILRGRRRPFAVEVIGDPYCMFAPGNVRSVLRPVLRWWIPRQLRQYCRAACAAGYVTTDYLQRWYPPGPGTYALGCSDIDLRDDAFVAQPRPAAPAGGPVRLVFVGSLAQRHKAVDVLIAALAANVQAGLDLRLRIIGEGGCQGLFAQTAATLGVTKRVEFVGQVAADEGIRAALDQADLFVLPSRTEGLPRVLLEAMARGLPCLATRVGGVPELLAAEDLVPPGDTAALADAIRAAATDVERRQRMAARNLARAREYQAAVLAPRRRAFYQALRERTVRQCSAGE